MNGLYRALASLFPEGRISDDEAVLACYSADSAIPPGSATLPSCVVLPKTTEEVLHLVQIADRFRVPVAPMARGSNIAGMAVPLQGGIVADLRLMNKIIEINKDAAYAVIEPGVTFHELSRELKKAGFFCHLPTAAGGSSPLANYLMRPSGNFAAKWDPDPVLSLEVVTPKAGIIKTGSASFETAGWRARYHCFSDLTGLFACSYGTLGIVTKGSVKIFDRGEEERLLLTTFDGFPPALEYMKRIVRRNLAESVTFWTWGWNMFHEMMLSKSEKMSEEMLKSDQRTPPPGIPFGIASARLSGYKEVVNTQENVCIKIARELGGDYLENEEASEKYPGCYRYLHSYFVEGMLPKPGEESQIRAGLHLPGCLLTAEPSKLIEIEKFMWDLAEREFKPPYFFRALPHSHAREFFFAFVVYVTGSLIEEREYLQHLKGIYGKLYRDLLRNYGGVMFRYRKDPTFFATTGMYGDLLRRIKKLLDPNNIMNPGMLLF
ncbi:MAG: FAD-binding oxidoreductase [Deltaproteobacteria bacterium]|nr:FAD-binding oxidoreductase [Deltaproteobacteria bacterium]